MSYFVLQWPWMLLLLAVLPVVWSLLARARYHREQAFLSMGQPHAGNPAWKDRLRITCLALIIIALSRPGFAPEKIFVSKSGRDVVFAIDVSQSMLAEDAHPSRLEAAKQGVRDALARLTNERVGLVVYAGSASVLCPLTLDHDFVRFMLEQTTTRTVDFGGTTMLSAVQKAVDSIFQDGREGMQDMVILTDGEDHESHAKEIVDLLKEHDAGLLLVGLGDSSHGARIPITDRDGKPGFLVFEKREVITRLNEAPLMQLASMLPGGKYVGPGTAPFDLGGIYRDYTLDLPQAHTDGEEGYLVYREAGLFIAFLALLIFLLTGRIFRRVMPLTAAAFLGATQGQNATFITQFNDALSLHLEGNYIAAVEAYRECEALAFRQSISPEQYSIVHYNLALCQIEQSREQEGPSPATALQMAQSARWNLLEAKRMNPGLGKAGQHLDPLARLIIHYEELVRKEIERSDALNQLVEEIVQRLQALHEDQFALLRKTRRKWDNFTNADGEPHQAACTAEGKAIRERLRAAHQAIATPPVQNPLDEAMNLMDIVVREQELALSLNDDPVKRFEVIAHQEKAITGIEKILDLLAQSGSSDESGMEDYEGDYDMDEETDAEEGVPSSQSMQGDLASQSEMQPLPVPNYSAEELLREEQGNLQFRQEQRARAQSGKVKKDW